MNAVAALTDDQRKHLDFIQAVIARMSSSSSTVKGWGLTVSMAAFGISANEAEPAIAVLGLVTVVFFGVLDAHYLRQEKLFRRLYDEARQGLIEVYSMDKDRHSDTCPLRRVITSWSVAGFYGPLLAVGTGAYLWALCG